MSVPQTARRAPARAPLVLVQAASNSDTVNVPAVAATAYLVNGKARPRVVLIVRAPTAAQECCTSTSAAPAPSSALHAAVGAISSR